MIPFAEAQSIVMTSVRRMGTERVPLETALYRILAEDITADSDLPPFNKSAMDGYACRRADLRNELRLLETIPAGSPPTRPIGANECSKIMTGAMVPQGADCVIMVEFTEESDGIVKFTGEGTRDNICIRGEDMVRGDLMIAAGTRILPRHVGALATAGCATPLVSLRPRVGVIATGDELVEPTETPGTSNIRNSNSYQLCAQTTAMGAIATYRGIAGDTEGMIGRMIAETAADSDVILVSGGVSAGDFDLVPAMLAKNGFKLLFEKVATKPGMPTVFGVRPTGAAGRNARGTQSEVPQAFLPEVSGPHTDPVFCFGLPGNPVSTFVLFELLVKPFLYAMMGHEFKPAVVPLRLSRDVTRKKTDRDNWIPVRITGAGEAEPVEYHGSGHLTSLPGAHGMICIPRGVAGAAKGDMVDVRQV